jgi:Ser/Thr protein kinase RdoA (MazF antagonist)
MALGSAGGFSGSRIWRGEAVDGSAWALKLHLPGMDVAHLAQVHHWMKTARDRFSFVPAEAITHDGRIVVEVDGCCWDCTTWMRGRADFHSHPTDAKLKAAVTAIAQIHQVWFTAREGPCSAIQRRHAVLTQWSDLVRRGWQPRWDSADPIATAAQSAWQALPMLIPQMLSTLEPLLTRLVPLQPCIGDVWHDHVLFDGNIVTGVIDFAAAKIDHVAADLARLLGSMIPDDPEQLDNAIRAYAAVRPLPNPELVAILDRSGVVASVANWLRRLYFDGEQVADRRAVGMRLALLTQRIDHWRNL